MRATAPPSAASSPRMTWGGGERMVEQAGFERPLCVDPMGLLRGWLTRRGPQPSYQAGLTSDW